MPQPERRPGGGPNPEREVLPRYHQAVRFAGEEPAGAAHFAAQEALHARVGAIDLSAYRFQLNRVYRVAVLGDPPPTARHDELQVILAVGWDMSSLSDRSSMGEICETTEGCERYE